jgi:hypothetical protein
MKIRGFLIFLLYTAFGGLLMAQKSQCVPDNYVSLFNGKDLNGWILFLKDPAVDPATVFTVKDAAIHITGNPFGYMRTREQYGNYRLYLEWRWPSEPTNSGVFIHAQEPDTIWPACFECQLKAGYAGDLICMGGTDMTERTDKTKIVVGKKAASNELPAGEWNTLEVICMGNTIEILVNGLLQNKATGITQSKGHICLQSEGKDIEFRSIHLIR